jgi:hypothetical protein
MKMTTRRFRNVACGLFVVAAIFTSQAVGLASFGCNWVSYFMYGAYLSECYYPGLEFGCYVMANDCQAECYMASSGVWHGSLSNCGGYLVDESSNTWNLSATCTCW